MTNNSNEQQSFVYTQLNDQIALFQRIQYSISHLLALSLNVKQFYLTHRLDPIRHDLSDQRGPESSSNEGVLSIPQSSSFTGALS